MEEKTKTVKLDTAKEHKRLTYEQLNDACNQLFQQNQYLMKQVKEINMANAFRRLDYLFKVIENSKVFGADFTRQCMEEIKDAMTIKDESDEHKE